MSNSTIGFGELSAISFNFRIYSWVANADAAWRPEVLTASSGRSGNAGKRAGAGAKDHSDADAKWQIVQRPGAKSGAQHGSKGNSNASRHGEPG
jgi:hypothetical protein